jgi:deoxycytidine triphosphate deaminase
MEENNSQSSAHWQSPLFLPPHSPYAATMTGRTTMMGEFRMVTELHTFEADFHRSKCRVRVLVPWHETNTCIRHFRVGIVRRKEWE